MQSHDARINMIKQQLRTWEVTDEHLIHLIADLAREPFVPKAFEKLAYSDYAIPLNNNHQLLSPQIVGRALQVLTIKPTEIALQVGTGLGYTTALMAKLAKHVYAMEIESEYYEATKTQLAAHDIRNVTLATGDGHEGWTQHAPYDVVFITGALPLGVTEALKTQLRIGGRLFTFIGTDPQQGVLITRTDATHWQYESLFETQVPALKNAPQPTSFNF